MTETVTPDAMPANMQAALDKGWIEKRGGYYVVVPHHREELDAVFPGDSIYGLTRPASFKPDVVPVPFDIYERMARLTELIVEFNHIRDRHVELARELREIGKALGQQHIETTDEVVKAETDGA